ncbi:hypothetical protein FRC19_006130 [Serendipita sp. 401]|nr:hypothetical protein FRC19_006130 [Serendipita sp. 401]KAG9024622.1 hypothetical protein FS842_005443 [Serendipita sp. 407]
MNSESMSSHGVYNMNSRFRPESRGGITTDGDSDADFQSAYSTSPRMTPIGTPIELERSSSGFGRRTSWRQSLNLVEKLQYGGLARPPSATGTVWSTGAVGGLGIIQDDTTARSRASSIGTNLEASSSTYGDRKAASHSGSSDHTIGAPEGAHERETNRSPHPPVSLATRGSSNATTKNRRDSDQMIAMPGVFPTTSL